MKQIYPITLNNVFVNLDRKNKVIDFLICVKEKKKKTP
jgi:hypothetical protein